MAVTQAEAQEFFEQVAAAGSPEEQQELIARSNKKGIIKCQ